MGNICYLVVNRPLVSRRTPSTWYLFLDLSRYPHTGNYGPPLARAWFSLISWGHKLVWGFIYYPVLMPCFTALFKLCDVLHLYCLGKRSVFAVSTSPVTFSGSQSFTAVPTNLESVLEPASFVAGSLVGWPLEIFLNPMIALSWMPCWVLSWFFRGWSSVCCYLCTPAG